jgi:uncharacterized protein (UPF0264 family)
VKLPEYKAINQARVWGCPVYVLDPKIQDGKKLPKWKARSRVGMYVGSSQEHSSTVGVVYSISEQEPSHPSIMLYMMSSSPQSLATP